MSTEKYKNWNVRRDDDGIHWLEINKENSKTNVLSKDVLLELEQELDLLKENLPKGGDIFIRERKWFYCWR